VAVADTNVAPGAEDGDDRLAFPVLRALVQLHHTGAATKRAHVVRGKPARAAQVLVGFLGHSMLLCFVIQQAQFLEIKALIYECFNTVIYAYADPHQTPEQLVFFRSTCSF
jgi:hypothetical protein